VILHIYSRIPSLSTAVFNLSVNRSQIKFRNKAQMWKNGRFQSNLSGNIRIWTNATYRKIIFKSYTNIPNIWRQKAINSSENYWTFREIAPHEFF